MPVKFDFISPGVSIREIDQSEVPVGTTDDGILLIGYAPQGPANVPIKVRNLEDFYTIFGKPISGKGSNSTDVWRDGNQQITTYAMYAAQSWLASGTSPVTFIRLLGSDQVSSKRTSAYVEAGWDTTFAASTEAASICAAYGLWVFPSCSTNDTVTGKLAAVIYSTGSAWGLSGTIAAEGNDVAYGVLTNTPIRSSTTGNGSTFTLVNSSSTVNKKYTFHLDRTKQDGYIRNVLNCNPQKTKAINYSSTETYFLGETFDEGVTRTLADAGSSSAGEQYGVLIPISDGTVHYNDHLRVATESKTGWFINRDPAPQTNFGSYDKPNHTKLFRLCSLHEGEWFQQNYGVRIENIRIGSTTNPDSTFSVVIINSDGADVERFDNLTLNESSVDFIGKRLGDQYQTYNDSLDKFLLYGEYPNRSDYVRVEMAEDWKQGIADIRMVPFGVWGPTRPNAIGILSGAAKPANTIGRLSVSASWHLGHRGDSADLLNMLNLSGTTLNLQWPELKLTKENSNNSGNYTKDYVFGVRHMLNTDNKPKKVLWDSPDYKDIVRALPGDLDIHSDGTKTEVSWIFSLDEIREEVGTNSTKFYYENGSHAAGNSFTKNSGSAKLITQGIRQFNAPFFGGFDGLDIRQVDPFSIATGLGSSNSENSNYAYYSTKRAIDIISDKDLLNYDIVSMPGLVNAGLTQDLIRMAEERADTLAIVDLDADYRKAYEANGVEALGTSTAAIAKAKDRNYDTSYAATYYPPVRLRDTAGGSGDVTIVPPSVAAIGAIGRSEALSEGPWFAPAGFNRGGIGVLGGNSGPRVVGTIEHLTKRDRDLLYEENINPIARFPAIGEIVIFGQKTLQQTPSALDRVNVRRLMIYLKKRIGRIADTILFDQNVQTTWLRFRDRADRILSDVRTRFGITEYRLVLDETTTTADLVDRNILYAKIFVKPARSIEFIAIDFVITRSGVEF
jgi:hypothetical protein